MAIAKSSIEKINFTGGLITETTPLTFPPNASKELNNFELNRDGSIQRRLGMIEEPVGRRLDTLRDANASANHAITSYKWNNVDNDPVLTLGVVQIGNALWFTDLSAETLSTAMLNKDEFGIAQPLLLDTNVLPDVISGNEPLSFTSLGGVLIIASSEMDHPLYIEYTQETPGFGDRVLRADTISIQVRDLWGPEDGIPVDERPPFLEDDHKYNLQNQGWIAASGNSGVARVYQRQARSISLQELYPKNYRNGQLYLRSAERGFKGVLRRIKEIQQIEKRHGLPIGDGTRIVFSSLFALGYPSNSDIRYTGNSTNSDGDPTFRQSLLNLAGPSTTPAPRGRYIIDAFKRGQSRIDQTNITDLPIDEELSNISVVATYANRLFYTGVESKITDPDDRSPDYTGCLFFSKSVENFSDFEKCYQSADPTEEDPLGLLATDGGFLKIAEASQIVKLVVSRASLVVIAKNGIWEITGPDGVFQADDYSISQVTNIGCESPESVIVAEDVVYYWSEGGIYALVSDDISGKLNAQNISERTIQTFFNAIPTTSKNAAKGRFDAVNRKITWMYNDSDDYNGINFKHSYNKELVLDTVLQAFYPREIGESSEGTTIAAYIEPENFVTVNEVHSVVVDGEQVVVNGEDVVITIPTKGRKAGVTKYLMMTPSADSGNYEFSFGLYGGLDFKDWGEIDSPAYLTTGAELGGDTQRDKQVPYLTMHFNRSESGFVEVDGGLEAVNPSSCAITSRWDFSDSSSSGKWGRPFEGYRLPRNFIPQDVDDEFDYGYEVITSKTKVRGRGKSVSLRFETAPAKDCQIIGWGMPINGVTTV
jgi:hypothetical protein